MITRKSESKILTKNTSCGFKCRFHGENVIHINGGIMINLDVSVIDVMYV